MPGYVELPVSSASAARSTHLLTHSLVSKPLLLLAKVREPKEPKEGTRAHQRALA
jgi:hypothetical protein